MSEHRCNLRTIRIGNDLTVKWAVLTNGKATSLENRQLTLTLWQPNGKRELTDFVIHGNTLSWTFPGREQRVTGDYTLTLAENSGELGMATIDQRAFRLVARMFGTNGLNEPEELVLETGDVTVAAGMYDLATEEHYGLLSAQDKRLLDILGDFPVLSPDGAAQLVRDVLASE